MVRLPLCQSNASKPLWPGFSLAASRVRVPCRAASPPQIPSTHHLKMSPTADCPASTPKNPGRIAPGTMPQMPGISATFLLIGTTAQSQVEVPITLTSVPSETPHAIAP